MRIWQAATLSALTLACANAAERQGSFTWPALEFNESQFTRDLGMLDSEREEYATNLASLSANEVADAKASAESLSEARRMLGLALQLSPRNKRALVVNFQLSRGVLPESSAVTYSKQVFARLLLTRGQLLEKQGGGENQRLARYFIQLAATMDPKNEDAVYASEVQRLDQGAVDWSEITDPPGKSEDGNP